MASINVNQSNQLTKCINNSFKNQRQWYIPKTFVFVVASGIHIGINEMKSVGLLPMKRAENAEMKG
jgi:hypothetical protein